MDPVRPPGTPPASAGWSAEPLVVAVADVGSHSTHLLVAATTGHQLEPLLDTSDILGLGAVVDREGYLPSPARAALVATLARYAATARELGAGQIAFLGTEPLRVAANALRVVAEVEAATGVPLHVLGPQEEARLTLLGVTGGMPLEVDMIIADIGGGSTQLLLATRGQPIRVHAIRLGASRLTDALVAHDPPTVAELACLRSEADDAFAGAPDADPRVGVLVGGSGSNLVKVAGPDASHRAVTTTQVASLVLAFGALPAAETAARYGIRPERARVLPAGAALVAALMARYGLPGVLVREEGIREGAALAIARAGVGWRDQVERLAQGWNG
jgi:exopolyphosphatase / guanosine-5'-triphosphate,3'-diphosphate pyrophosphatase